MINRDAFFVQLVVKKCTFCSPVDEVLSENFLDYKNRGVNGSHKGQIVWKIDASSYFMECRYSLRFLSHSVSHLAAQKRSCFLAV